MMNGVYEIGGYISGGTIIANLYGVTTESGDKLTTINCCVGNPISMLGIELHINNTYMLGATENIGRAFYFGLQPNALYCDNCYFLGQQTVYAAYGDFTNCTFDSSVFELYQDSSKK
ncbi:MAG: hypothetical protein MJ200_00725 [Mycoplasmoidaceae bacterium]|nr:hypothetical protein [Mycoplasmoidaceae bacterium]